VNLKLPADTSADRRSGAASGLTIGFAGSVDEALAQARRCDVVLVSATLPEGRALAIVAAVAQAEPRVRVLVKDLVETEQGVVPYLKAGAAGWLL
jgi:DNA-binding NarL/FixJ family response regulator